VGSKHPGYIIEEWWPWGSGMVWGRGTGMLLVKQYRISVGEEEQFQEIYMVTIVNTVFLRNTGWL
jgi:hypothetical protein